MIEHEPTSLRIGEVAELAGVRTSLIRYYEDIGLLPEPARLSGQRRYDESVLRRLAVIDVAQRAGMTLDDIRLLVQHGNDALGDQLRELAQRKLPEIRTLIERAQRVERWLQTAASCGCQSIDGCELFDEPRPSPREPPFSLPVSRMGAPARGRP